MPKVTEPPAEERPPIALPNIMTPKLGAKAQGRTQTAHDREREAECQGKRQAGARIW